jgi:hypothetical protein
MREEERSNQGWEIEKRNSKYDYYERIRMIKRTMINCEVK